MSIKLLNLKGYIHGCIKLDNFLYKNSNEYHLIDFNSTYNSIFENKKIATFPFISPERNNLCGWYSSEIYNHSEVWSVGIILFFYGKIIKFVGIVILKFIIIEKFFFGIYTIVWQKRN